MFSLIEEIFDSIGLATSSKTDLTFLNTSLFFKASIESLVTGTTFLDIVSVILLTSIPRSISPSRTLAVRGAFFTMSLAFRVPLAKDLFIPDTALLALLIALSGTAAACLATTPVSLAILGAENIVL